MSTSEPSVHNKDIPKPFAFNSEHGRSLISRIIQQYAPYIPHTYVLEGLGEVLEGKDLFAVTPTGSGKTGYIAFTAVIVKELVRYPDKYPEVTRKFPKNPIMLAICPTNYLEYQLEDKLTSLGLKLLVINEETKAEAYAKSAVGSDPPDLWARAVEDLEISIIVMSPEQLKSSEYAHSLKKEQFSKRIYALAVDEAHLLLTWGRLFRKPFQQIGLARSRLPESTVLIALSATMRGGEAITSVRRFLGLIDGYYHLIRRSNQRHDIQLIFREVSSPPNGRFFPELDWILHGNRKTLIFCRSINLGNRVHEYMYYLDKQLGGDPVTITKRMREYNSLSKEFNEDTRKLMQSGECSLVFATSTLAIGVDIDSVEDVVIYGDPEDVDELLQMVGRIRPRYEDGVMQTYRGIVYFAAKARKRAEYSLAKKLGSSNKTIQLESEAGMDESLAELYLAECKIDSIDKQYENPTTDSVCHCPTCTRYPPPARPLPCRCSGANCTPEAVVSASKTSVSGNAALNDHDLPKKGQRITLSMRTHGTRRLKLFRLEMFRSADSKTTCMLPPDVFFRDEEIKQVLDQFALLRTIDDVMALISRLGNKHLTPFAQELFERLQQLKTEFAEIKEEEKRKRNDEKVQKKS